MIKKLKEAAMLSAASGRTTMYLPPSGATLGVAASAKKLSSSASKQPERAVSHAQLHRSEARPTSKPPASKLASSASPAMPSLAAKSKSSATVATRDERRKTITGAQLKSSQSAPAVAHAAKPKRGSFTAATESTAAGAADIALSTPTVVIGQSLKPKCVECRLRDATTKVEFDGHQRYVCAKCAERFTALQKALSFDNDDNDRAATPPPPPKKVQSPPPERDVPPTPPMPARLREPVAEADYGEAPPALRQAEPDYGEAPPALRQHYDAPPKRLLSMPVVERVAIPERRVEVTAAYVSDSDSDDDDGGGGYLPLAAGARVLGTMSLSDSDDDDEPPEVPESPTVQKLRLDTIDSIIGMEPLSDDDEL
jgi:hypothetical protein